jgi:release factor glutamine methyltransferase
VTRSELVQAIATQVGGTQQARWVVEDLTGLGQESTEIDDHLVDQVFALARQVKAGRPLQYALGTWGFRSLTLVVDERALIPRPETEHLVGVAIEAARLLNEDLVVVDLGTGTGAIALSIATECPGAEVHAVDLSYEALSLAQLNASRLNCDIMVHHGSWWSALPESLHGRVNVLIANPPYVTEDEYQDLEIQLSFEPRSALVAPRSTTGVDGFGDLEAIVLGAEPFLAPRAVIVFECAPQQCNALQELASSIGSAEIIVDLASRQRGVMVRREK